MDIKSQVNRRGKERREEGKGEENEDNEEERKIHLNFTISH